MLLAVRWTLRPQLLSFSPPSSSPTRRLIWNSSRAWPSAPHNPRQARKRPEPQAGTTTPTPSEELHPERPLPPFYFETGYALFAKRASKPFPPPFVSPPSGSFSDPLSTHDRSRDRRSFYNGQMIRGVTNGDDAVLVSENFVAANDGVGAWMTKDRGHAALWSRLILHFWALEVEKNGLDMNEGEAQAVKFLQAAYEHTIEATSQPSEWYGTTTASAALLSDDHQKPPNPLLYVTQLGDSAVMIIRPKESKILFKTKEQWHWFDCPRQLGTNSPDTPEENAHVDKINIQEGDVVIVSSDGVGDNLWDHEVMQVVIESIDKWDQGTAKMYHNPKERTHADRMQYVAEELMHAARVIAEDPFAESPYMEKAVDEGLGIEGGKLDDISVVAALCRRRTG